ncbi:M1 family metallopeptidase [Chitinophaga rhizosphaerae]|uniref:M1 family metallopeptidase n=1 Tax=Chitinophaga rhizosphaerae TaxID=1864947 RepID=UPI0013DEB2EB|nr:M1 family metallopeptidase [Chitinophaga rhizosphaerae]
MMRLLPFLLTLFTVSNAFSQHNPRFTRQDTLRGTLGPERSWWDVTFYDLQVRVFPDTKSIEGTNVIHYRVTGAAGRMQIDLQQPMELKKAVQDGKELTFVREGNAFFIDMPAHQPRGQVKTIALTFGGKPREAKNAPWDGGIVWKTDSLGRPWIASACQGLGASVFWPNKDHQSEEPDSMRIAVTVPAQLTNVSNGRLRTVKDGPEGTRTFTWSVANPINNYDVALNIGHYAHFSDTFKGEAGRLPLDFWVLDYHLSAAKKHFGVVKPMMQCFEHWFGPYPFYADSYKLVETPHLGMEHQSAVAYGNQYKMGYRGKDLSGSGWGLKWDFIIIHETGHEWFGNNITTKDIADMWVHESFTNYSETLFTECRYGKEAGNAYLQGIRKNIANDVPIIGPYGVNTEGSGDMYYKGANMLHTIRQIVGNDEKFRQVLRGLNKTFWHQTVTTEQVEDFINKTTGINFDKVFDQYLRHTQPPVFEYDIADGQLKYRWVADVKGFDMPLRVSAGTGKPILLQPTGEWKSMPLKDASKFTIDPNFYILVKKN